ncbi:MAG TPA: alpha/beta hydrolase [Candidatus Saccharimonadia bacterium]|nr:alpha/beta hydrolase [Candidatus Saccharimonadia bacterium]
MKKVKSKSSRDLLGRLSKRLLAIAFSILLVFLLAYIAFQVNPWPGALLVRAIFNHSDKAVLTRLEKYTPTTPITVLSDQPYEAGDKNALLDVYIPQTAEQGSQLLPVVIWTHGGAWVSGDKTNDAPYFKSIAAHNLVVVSLNYSLAPEKSSPTQTLELNAAHAYVAANAKRFRVDPNKIFLAGDSAGAQLSSQMAALITNPDYAQEVGVRPALAPQQLAGVILFCGIYQLEGLTEAAPSLPRIISWADDRVVWAFSGSPDKSGPLIRQLSPYYHVTGSFPPTFISGGNGDPLTDHQSKPLAGRLTALGVPVTSLFYPADHQPSLAHEYQFNLDTADGQRALDDILEFVRQRDQ